MLDGSQLLSFADVVQSEWGLFFISPSPLFPPTHTLFHSLVLHWPRFERHYLIVLFRFPLVVLTFKHTLLQLLLHRARPLPVLLFFVVAAKNENLSLTVPLCFSFHIARATSRASRRLRSASEWPRSSNVKRRRQNSIVGVVPLRFTLFPLLPRTQKKALCLSFTPFSFYSPDRHCAELGGFPELQGTTGSREEAFREWEQALLLCRLLLDAIYPMEEERGAVKKKTTLSPTRSTPTWT